VVLGLRCHARRQARRRARTTRGARGTTRWDGSPRPVGRRGPVGAEGTFLSRRAPRSLGHSPLPRPSRLPSPPFLLPLTPSSPVSFLPFGSSTHHRESTPGSCGDNRTTPKPLGFVGPSAIRLPGGAIATRQRLPVTLLVRMSPLVSAGSSRRDPSRTQRPGFSSGLRTGFSSGLSNGFAWTFGNARVATPNGAQGQPRRKPTPPSR
jgi:hypothetical protein